MAWFVGAWLCMLYEVLQVVVLLLWPGPAVFTAAASDTLELTEENVETVLDEVLDLFCTFLQYAVLLQIT